MKNKIEITPMKTTTLYERNDRKREWPVWILCHAQQKFPKVAFYKYRIGLDNMALAVEPQLSKWCWDVANETEANWHVLALAFADFCARVDGADPIKDFRLRVASPSAQFVTDVARAFASPNNARLPELRRAPSLQKLSKLARLDISQISDVDAAALVDDESVSVTWN